MPDTSQLEARMKRFADALRGPIAKGLYQLMDSELGKLTTIDFITSATGPTWSNSQQLHIGHGALSRAYTKPNDAAHIHEENETENGWKLTFGIRGSNTGAGAYAAAQEYGAVITANPIGRARFFAAKFLETAGHERKSGGKVRLKSGAPMQGLRGLIISLLKQGKGVPFWGIMALSIMKTGRTQIPARMHLRLAVREFNSNPESKGDIGRWYRESVMSAWNG